MPRLARHAFTALFLLSLLLCVAVCVLWVRSYWGSDYLYFWKVSPPSQPPGNVEIYLVTLPGRARIERLAQVYSADEYPPHWHDRVGRGWWTMWGRMSYWIEPPYIPDPPAMYGRSRLGFQFAGASQGMPTLPGHFGGVVLPFWSIALALALWPAARLRSWHALRRRRRLGLCPACGYDRRGHTPGERCPECGLRQAQSSEAAAASGSRGAGG